MEDNAPQDIIDFEKRIIDRNNARLAEQRIDQSFLDNTYDLTLIKKAAYQMRTNFAARMINAVTQQLVSNLPKVYLTANADNDTAKKSTNKISDELNMWVAYLLRQSSNPFEQTFKNFNYRGESWLYVPHNAEIAKGGESEYGLPVHFIMFDPMVVFSDPNEEVDGEPTKVMVKFETTVADIRARYPFWQTDKNDSAKCMFKLYFDKKKSFASADGDPLFTDKKGNLVSGSGERPNIYKCVPFGHMYSGWGFESQGRDPELLAYSRIRMIRDLITEDSQVRSDQLYNFHTFAHRSKTLYLPAGGELNADWAAAFQNEPDKLNVLQLPEGASPDWFKVEDSQLFDASAFAYADRIRMDLGQEFPSPLQGGTGTSSGREANILSGNALAVYDCALENTALIWAKGFMKALKIADAMGILPDGLSKEDVKRAGILTVDLRNDDPVARDRQISMGSQLVDAGKRSLKTFLMRDMRMTETEADEEIDNILMEKIMLQSPELAAFLGYKAAEKSGMADELNAFRQMREGNTGIETGNPIGSKGGEKRQGNIKTETGRQMVDVSNSAYGTRTPAVR